MVLIDVDIVGFGGWDVFGVLLRDIGSYMVMFGFCFACFVVGFLLLLILGGYLVFRCEVLLVY